MSGFEIAGLVSGVISLLPLAYDAINTIKNRLNDFRLTTRKIAAIENTLDRISHHSQQLRTQYENHHLQLSPPNASIIENDFEDIKSILQHVTYRLRQISEYDQSGLSRKRLRHLFNGLTLLIGKKYTSICDETIIQLNTASDRLRDVNHVLVTVTTHNTSQTQKDIVHGLHSLAIPDKNRSGTQDTYVPSFYVPANPPIAKQCLDYLSVDDDGQLITSEGNLKARLLQLVNKRQDNPDSLPIVAAVGMPGTGKSCALRGLNTENDLRQIFPDGILFLFCGPSASVESTKQGLCSMVSRTGGNALSQKMDAIFGANAIDVMIDNVSAWFKDKKCLFLVDDIWNTTAAGVALLSKLSTVVENCHTTSGLVYTTRDERIDTFDTSVCFKRLAPHSPVSRSLLSTAAGFSLEQIVGPDQQQAFGNILTHCDGLKIALVVAGREVRMRAARYGEHRAKAWESYANILYDRPNHLLTQEYGEYGSLYFQFSTSLETLSSQESNKLSFHMPYRVEQIFESLCVVPKGQVLYDSFLCRLWDLRSLQQVREISKLLVDFSLAETSVEFIDGEHEEGILVHDLVHDYATCLADQHYSDRRWIKGWEVWGLRLLESFFGSGESIVTSSQSFEGWWEGEDISRNWDLNHLDFIISRFASSSRLQNGQTPLKHSLGIERFVNVDTSISDPEPFMWVGVCFTLCRSTVGGMHDFISTMARERGVTLSNFTCRILMFAALLLLRLDRLVKSNHFVVQRVQKSNLHAYEDGILSFHHRDPGSPPKSQNTSLNSDVVCHAYVLPRCTAEYLRASIGLNWTFYDNCVAAPDTNGEEDYRFLGPSLTYESLMEAGIKGIFVLHALLSMSGTPDSDDITAVKAMEDPYHFIFTPYFKANVTLDDDAEACSAAIQGYEQYLHVHDVGNRKDPHSFTQQMLEKILELWCGMKVTHLRQRNAELFQEK